MSVLRSSTNLQTQEPITSLEKKEKALMLDIIAMSDNIVMSDNIAVSDIIAIF
jgi:hypothetical protein